MMCQGWGGANYVTELYNARFAEETWLAQEMPRMLYQAHTFSRISITTEITPSSHK